MLNKTTYIAKPAPSNTWTWIFFTSGVLLGIASGVLAFIFTSGASAVVAGTGAGAAVMAICLTFRIALNQNADTSDLRKLGKATHDLGGHTNTLGETTNQVLIDIQSVLFKIEEQTANQAYDPIGETPLDGQNPNTAQEDSSDKPSYADEVIETLQTRKANLDFNDLMWRRKTTDPATTGNHGWFVESSSRGESERWFVRKANGLTVRKAMPRHFLEALEEKADLDPRQIKHDFQLSNHGLAAWYARTYSDELWKVSRSNRNAQAGITVSREDSDV